MTDENYDDNNNRFVDAAWRGDLDLVRRYLMAGRVHVNCTNWTGWTALYGAAMGDRIDVVQFLLQCKANVDARNAEKETPLHCAASNGHVAVAALLLDANACVDATEEEGRTPLHCTVLEYRDSTPSDQAQVLQLLLLHDADATVRNRNGQTPTEVALANPDRNEIAIRYLEQAVAKKNPEKHQQPEIEKFEERQTVEWLISRKLFTVDEATEIARRFHSAGSGVKSFSHIKILSKTTIRNLIQGWGLTDIQKDTALYMHQELQKESKTGTNENHRAFICHTGQDPDARNFAAHLAEALSMDGFHIFFDAYSIRAGVPWKEEIDRNVKECTIFVCIMSKTFFFRYWCLHELDLALQWNKKIIPVYYQCGPPKVDNDFQSSLKKSLQSSEKEVDDETFCRFCQNVTGLHDIQGIRNYYSREAKLSQVAFIKQIVAEIDGSAGHLSPPNTATVVRRRLEP